MSLFAFNDDAQVTPIRIGRRKITVARVDNVLLDPEAVAALGFTQTYAQDRSNFYPGLRSPVPESFSIAFRAWLAPILRDHGLLDSGGAIHSDATFFAFVSTASTELLPIQRIPHYDSTDPNLFAAVIYLCDTRFSGTSFYRHRKTGYEEITEENCNNYRLALDTDMRLHGAPSQHYMNGENALFEVIFANELRFNSAIIYPGRVLHAANINKQFSPPKDKSEWRLTVTALLKSG